MEKIPSSRRKILYIDDDPNLVKIIEEIMDMMNYDIVTSIDSIRAMESIRSNPSEFDLIITDMNMPKISGVQLCRELSEICPELPVILCTGSAVISDEDEIMQNGVKKVIYKPYAINELIEAVDELLE